MQHKVLALPRGAGGSLGLQLMSIRSRTRALPPEPPNPKVEAVTPFRMRRAVPTSHSKCFVFQLFGFLLGGKSRPEIENNSVSISLFPHSYLDPADKKKKKSLSTNPELWLHWVLQQDLDQAHLWPRARLPFSIVTSSQIMLGVA